MTRAFKFLFVVGLALSGRVAVAAPPPPISQQVCQGAPDAERQVAFLTDARNIMGVEELRPQEPMIESMTPDPRGGARILLGARPGMTVEWLQRIAECHLAHNAARGYQGDTQSPLDVREAMVNVSSVGDGFAIDITSYDRKLAREILRRARDLLATAPKA